MPNIMKGEKQMLKVKVSGLNELKKQLKQLEKASKELSQTKQVSFKELFPRSFMEKYTSFSSMDELVDAGFGDLDFESIPDDEFDKHISATTKFDNWDEMLGEASSQYAMRKLGL